MERASPRLATMFGVEPVEALGQQVSIVELSETTLDRGEPARERGGAGPLQRVLEIGQIPPSSYPDAHLMEPLGARPAHRALTGAPGGSFEAAAFHLEASHNHVGARGGDRTSQGHGDLFEEPGLSLRPQGGAQEFAAGPSVVAQTSTQRPEGGVLPPLGGARFLQEPVDERQGHVQVPYFADELGQATQPGIERGPGTTARPATYPRRDPREGAQAAKVAVEIMQVLGRGVRPLDHTVRGGGRRREALANVVGEPGRRK